jgi:hypothetical protein
VDGGFPLCDVSPSISRLFLAPFRSNGRISDEPSLLRARNASPLMPIFRPLYMKRPVIEFPKCASFDRAHTSPELLADGDYVPRCIKLFYTVALYGCVKRCVFYPFPLRVDV